MESVHEFHESTIRKQELKQQAGILVSSGFHNDQTKKLQFRNILKGVLAAQFIIKKDKANGVYSISGVKCIV